ncbi:MAG: 4Fe-4S binding protein [Candidatus Binatia bacterium]|jgi:Na+-translocating ferredoxin:NAD+ oxidoreductase subunit B
MSEDVYLRLRAFMDTLPAGYPATPTGVEIKILKKLFTPEQAELAARLRHQPEEVRTIAARVGMNETELAPMLEEMAQKGCIFRVRDGDKRLYQAYHFVVGLYEFQLKNLDREFCELFEEYLPYLGASIMSAKTRQMRVIPVESALSVAPVVASYNQVRDLVRQQEVISVSQCICRKEQGLLGNPCHRPQEVCLGFGNFGRFYLDNKLGRQIGTDEALKILDLAEESALVLMPTNSEKIEAICCCCPCCCPTLKYAKISPRPADFIQSYYQAKIDPELCTGCGLCPERCQVDAIAELDGIWSIVDGRCIGCGLCISSCPVEAMSMVSKPGMEAPPKEFRETLNRIGTERGVL